MNSLGKESLWHAGGNRKVTSDASPSLDTLPLVLSHVRLFKHVVEMAGGSTQVQI